MATDISPLAVVDPRALLGADVRIGPFCMVGPQVVIGDRTALDSHVVLVGRTTIGSDNRFWPNCVIGGEPQDKSYHAGDTAVEIGSHNQFREGVTVNRGADKEDGCTRIGDWNLLMSNYFSTIGTLAFVSGGCRVPNDVPPFMMWAGSDDPGVVTINLVGLQRSGMSAEGIARVKLAYRLLYREHKPLDVVRAHFVAECRPDLPADMQTLLGFLEFQRAGRMGRGREAVRKPAAAQVPRAA
jgi:UDP-N-acetylglucosamine acyltransferase